MIAVLVQIALSSEVAHLQLLKVSVMGSESSKTEIVRVEVPVEVEAKSELLSMMKKEVSELDPVIKDGVMSTVLSQQDALIMEYSSLTDINQLKDDIKAMFKSVDDVNILDFIIDTATTMVSALKQSKDLTKAERWHQTIHQIRKKDKVIGMEAQYKIRIEDKLKGVLFRERKTVVVIGYKILIHILDQSPDDFLDHDELKSLTF